MFLNDMKEKSIIPKVRELEELFPLDEMLKEYPERHLSTKASYRGIYKERIHPRRCTMNE